MASRHYVISTRRVRKSNSEAILEPKRQKYILTLNRHPVAGGWLAGFGKPWMLSAAGVMALPMCRRDIADYLGLTLETVSRALSQLHSKRILSFVGQTQRQIVLLDRTRLADLDL
jgi:CRP-like cAMP-binding protein